MSATAKLTEITCDGPSGDRECPDSAALTDQGGAREVRNQLRADGWLIGLEGGIDRCPKCRSRSTGGERGETEWKAARRLRVLTPVVAEAAVELWGRSLSAERDARMAAQDADASPSRRRALRGHITRELLKQLSERIGNA